jgi:two-component system sensor histidine kinase/response regulator
VSAEEPAGDSDALKRALRDMVAFSVLPAVWGQFEPHQLAESLAQVVQNTLGLPLVYVRLQQSDGVAKEIARTNRFCSSAEAAEIGLSLAGVLAQESGDRPLSLQNPVGGGTVRCLRVPIAWRGGQWTLVAAGVSQTFPTLEERLLLSAAANHAAVALERANTFRSLRESELRAESANREKDEFLANVSHEIRTPMNAILGLTDLALDSPLSGQQHEWLAAVKSAGEHLLVIIDGLLDFSKVGANKLKLDLVEFSLRRQVIGPVRALAARAQRKGLEFVIDIDDGVPEQVIGDASRLRQILINLVDNAIKFTAAGEVMLLVSVGEAKLAGSDIELCFAVCDTGIGIPAHQHRVIFEAFAQADPSTTRRYGGTGLGLTIAAKLALLMEGQISVRSEPGLGSKFTLLARFGSPPQGKSKVALAPQWPGVRVLVIHRKVSGGEVLKRWLEGWRLDADFVHDGFWAIQELMRGATTSRQYRLVLVDGEAPGSLDSRPGSPTHEHRHPRAIRVLLLGPQRNGEMASALTEVTVRKPVIKEELCAAIQRVLEPWHPDARTQLTAQSGARAAPALALRVLVCEDNELNAMLVEELLRRRGHQAHVVRDGNEVLSVLEAEPYDLLLLDLHMPGLDGFRVIQEIRARERHGGGHLPVIALTARSREQDRERCLAAGMDGFLPKPINSAALWAAIAQILQPPP